MGIQPQLLPQLGGHPLRIGAGSVTLVDKGNTGNLVAGHLPINGDRLRLDAANGTEHQHRAIENPQGALNLNSKVDMAGGINDIDVLSLPVAKRRR